jgi:hypothetical protein
MVDCCGIICKKTQDGVKISLSEARNKARRSFAPKLLKMNREWFSHAILIEKGTKINFLLFQQNYWFGATTLCTGWQYHEIWSLFGSLRGDLVCERKIKSDDQILKINCGTNFLGCGWKMRRFSQMLTKKQVDSKKTVCSTFGLQGWGRSLALESHSRLRKCPKWQRRKESDSFSILRSRQVRC